LEHLPQTSRRRQPREAFCHADPRPAEDARHPTGMDAVRATQRRPIGFEDPHALAARSVVLPGDRRQGAACRTVQKVEARASGAATGSSSTVRTRR
jgi:hypothetical protein